MKLTGELFENSVTCKGVGYSAEGAVLDIAKIEISGRYPEHGWAINEKIHEIAYVQRGTGILFIRDVETFSLQEGDVAYVAPGQHFAWSGNMTLILSCSPPFDSTQYKVENKNEV